MLDILRLAIIIPLAAAVITGAFVGALVLVLAAWRGWPGTYGFIAAAASALVSWFAWSARFAAVLEHRIAPNLRQPQDTTPKEINLRIHRENEGGYLEGLFLNRLPIGAAELETLANLVMDGASLTTSGITSSGLLTRAEWEVLRDKLVSAGLLNWRGSSRVHGCEPTARGLAVFTRLASPPLPLPRGRIAS